MAISSTYIVLQRQVADELGDRTDLLTALSDSSLTLSPVKNAIQSAIAKWEREPFYFNEVYGTLFTTVSAQETYTSSDAAAIATSPDLIHLHVLVNANRYELTPRSWQYIDGISVNPQNTGEPVDYAVFAEQIRLYPIPNGAYPVTQSGTTRPAALSNDSDANVWTQDAYDLIRSEAKLILAREVLHDDAMEARMVKAIYGNPGVRRERGYLAALKAETMRRATKARVRPTYF